MLKPTLNLGADTYFHLAGAFVSQGNPTDAIKAFNMATQKNPE